MKKLIRDNWASLVAFLGSEEAAEDAEKALPALAERIARDDAKHTATGGTTMLTDAERLRELARLHTEMLALEADHAARTAAIRDQINALCGLAPQQPYKPRRERLSRRDFAAACGL